MLSDSNTHADQPRTRVLAVRTNLALHDRLQQIARQNGDTVAGTIRALLRDAVERRDREAE